MKSLSRRTAMGLIAAAGLAACTNANSGPGSSAAANGNGGAPLFPVDPEPLKNIARTKGILFGSAMADHQLNDPDYVRIILAECDVIVAENEHKWYTIHPQPDVWNFEPADALVNFAQSNGLKMRGHTVLWHHPRWFPDWVNELEFANAAEAEAMLDDYITRVVSRAHPFIHSWDVINEAVDDETGELRETSFSRAMGGPMNVMEYAFRKTAELSPGTALAYNDYMSWETGNENHRNGVLRLMEELLRRGAPLTKFGIQSHSNYEMPDEFTPEKQRAWRAFCEEAIGMGLDLSLTEFDVNDTRLGPDIEMRDQLIAAFTKDYLDIMLSYPQTKELLMWGMVDNQSWLQDFLPREDGVEKRPTLYDSSYQPKLMREAVAAALRDAPVRS